MRLTVSLATALAELADTFRSVITLSHGRWTTDARSILGILSLGAGQGALVRIAIEGDDARAAGKAIKGFVSQAPLLQGVSIPDRRGHGRTGSVGHVLRAARRMTRQRT